MNISTPAEWLALVAYVEREARVSAEVERLMADGLRFAYAYALDSAQRQAKQAGAMAAIIDSKRLAYWSEAAEVWQRVAEATEARGAYHHGVLAACRHHRLSLKAPRDRSGEDAEGWLWVGLAIARVLDEQAEGVVRQHKLMARREEIRASARR